MRRSGFLRRAGLSRGWLQRWLEEREVRLLAWIETRQRVRREAAELVQMMGAEAAFWHVRGERRDRSKPEAERARLNAIMHRIYRTEERLKNLRLLA